MRDFKTYGTYIANGAATPKSLDIRLKQVGHDARIAEALKDFLNREPKPKLVGIMGGHGLPRSTRGAYADVARFARHLTQIGYLIVTGGGPGAMEAGHLGATFSSASDAVFEQALNALASVPDLPTLVDVVAANRDPAPGNECAFNKARLWLNKASAPVRAAHGPASENLHTLGHRTIRSITSSTVARRLTPSASFPEVGPRLDIIRVVP